MVIAETNRGEPVTTSNITSILKASSATDTAALKARLACEVILPGDDAYDEARRLPNLNVDRKPAVIVRPRAASDIAEAMKFARENDLPLSIRSGGHAIPGFGLLDDAVAIDMTQFRAITIDPENGTARVQPAATSGELGAAAHAYGLALTT